MEGNGGRSTALFKLISLADTPLSMSMPILTAAMADKAAGLKAGRGHVSRPPEGHVTAVDADPQQPIAQIHAAGEGD